MYPAIEAISRHGTIEPLEPVHFDDNERLVILRISKTIPTVDPRPSGGDWRHFVGRLRHSPSLKGDPVALQRGLRDEWD